MCARTTDEQEKIESSADIFGEHAQKTIAEALSARRQFVEKLTAVDPTLVAEFYECVTAMFAALQLLGGKQKE
ncbi:MAG TPA: hypothetical protein VHW01_25400 [Polyangiaceae bacterium]|jgi:hypothetical protein|nr:hypothetical protein [Polyangiaceae bacterium]